MARYGNASDYFVAAKTAEHRSGRFARSKLRNQKLLPLTPGAAHVIYFALFFFVVLVVFFGFFFAITLLLRV